MYVLLIMLKKTKTPLDNSLTELDFQTWRKVLDNINKRLSSWKKIIIFMKVWSMNFIFLKKKMRE